MTDRFQHALAHVLKSEGGYVDHPEDPGGATNLGVTHKTLAAWVGRPVTKDEVRRLTPQSVAPIYRANYWAKAGCHDQPAGVDLVTFDAAVNSGVSRGVKWTQRAAGARIDGAWGPETRRAVWEGAETLEGRVRLIQRACGYRMSFLESLRHWRTFGKGWSRRVARVEADAVAWAGAGPVIREQEAKKAKTAADAQAAAAGGATAGGGGMTTVDLPVSIVLPILSFMAFVLAFLILRFVINRARARAYMETLT